MQFSIRPWMMAAALAVGLLGMGARPAATQTSSSAGNATDILAGAPVLRGADLQRKMDGVRANAQEEAYLQVPWRTNLPAAIVEAREQKKPLFIWAMTGNPLCWT